MAKQNSVVMNITRNVNKKGKLKGKNKKETKFLKASCPHNKITKSGKLKSTVSINDNYCICELCGKRFPASFYDDSEIKNVVNSMIELNNQNKFTATAANCGEETVKYFSNMGVILDSYKKRSKKTRNLAKKTSAMKKKKHGNNNNYNSYGSWGTTKR